MPVGRSLIARPTTAPGCRRASADAAPDSARTAISGRSDPGQSDRRRAASLNPDQLGRRFHQLAEDLLLPFNRFTRETQPADLLALIPEQLGLQVVHQAQNDLFLFGHRLSLFPWCRLWLGPRFEFG